MNTLLYFAIGFVVVCVRICRAIQVNCASRFLTRSVYASRVYRVPKILLINTHEIIIYKIESIGYTRTYLDHGQKFY